MTDIDLLVLPTALMPAPLLTEGSSYSHLETPNFTMHGIGFGNEYQPAAGVPVLQRWQRHVSDGCAEPAEHRSGAFRAVPTTALLGTRVRSGGAARAWPSGAMPNIRVAGPCAAGKL
jgi:hypothetical protein